MEWQDVLKVHIFIPLTILGMKGEKMMKLIALGSGGWHATGSRHTASYLIDTGESLIILDTGSGLSRLSNHLDILNKYEEINIIYSHYHLDYIIGLSYINNWSKEKRLNIYGPGKTLGFTSCQDVNIKS